MTARTFDWTSASQQAAQDRFARLNAELQEAVRQTDRMVLADWGKDVLQCTGQAGWRRVRRIGHLCVRIGKSSATEAKNGVQAARDGHFRDHATRRGQSAWDATKNFAQRSAAAAKTVADLLKNRETMPAAVTTIVAALVASGGPDANGGIPDLDLQFGIGAHRSIFTHSIVAGTLVEGCLYGTATLVGIVYGRLPPTHDPWWDVIERNRTLYLKAASTGMSAGIAY